MGVLKVLVNNPALGVLVVAVALIVCAAIYVAWDDARESVRLDALRDTYRKLAEERDRLKRG